MLLAGGAMVFGSALMSGVAYAEAEQATPTSKSPLVLYQYAICPWCCKVKAVLDYYKLPYNSVEVNPLWKTELKFSEYKKVPVVILPNADQLNDSNIIIQHIVDNLVPHSEQAQKKGWYVTDAYQ